VEQTSGVSTDHSQDRGVHAQVAGGPRRRTLGPCAHCHQPVDVNSEHVRLYRLAWHVECALASGGHPAAQLAPPA